jgi:hypothetical protein
MYDLEFLQGHGWHASAYRTSGMDWGHFFSPSPTLSPLESQIINLAVADGSYDQGAQYNAGGSVPPANAISATGDAQARVIGILPVPQSNARPTSPAKPGANLAPYAAPSAVRFRPSCLNFQRRGSFILSLFPFFLFH